MELEQILTELKKHEDALSVTDRELPRLAEIINRLRALIDRESARRG